MVSVNLPAHICNPSWTFSILALICDLSIEADVNIGRRIPSLAFALSGMFRESCREGGKEEARSERWFRASNVA